MNKINISFETENLTVRSLQEEDKESYIALRREASNIAEAYKIFEGRLEEEEWKDIISSTEDLFLMAFSKEDGRMAACASFQFIESDDVELGIDVAKAFRNKGVATELITEMVRLAREIFPGKKIILKTERNNIACRRAAEKSGGAICRYEPHPYMKVMDGILTYADGKWPGNEKFEQLKREYIEVLRDSKDMMCIYSF